MSININSILSSISKNNVDTEGTDNFLENYSREKVEVATNIGYNALSSFEKEDPKTNFCDIFYNLNIKLDCDINCIDGAASLIDINCENLDSYNDFEQLALLKFSLLDMFSNNHRIEIQKIKQIFEYNYPIILINTYKFKMMADFYIKANLQQDFIEIIYKLILLTLMSVVDDIESCDEQTITDSDINLIIESLCQAPSMEFCKQWMKMHQISCIIENKHDKKCIIYNYKEYNPKVYIYFEFYSKMLVILKAVKFTQ